MRYDAYDLPVLPADCTAVRGLDIWAPCNRRLPAGRVM